MRLFVATLLVSKTLSYFMDPYITCYENNKYSFTGFHDPNYANDTRYIDNGGEGDVCDHEPGGDYVGVRDMCYFQVQLGAEVWTYKCMHHMDCPVKDENGIGTGGCMEIPGKRITCCCNEDLCNGEDMVKYADLGYPDNYNGETNILGDTDSDTDTDTDGYHVVTSTPFKATQEQCYITNIQALPCSCGASCEGFEHIYYANVDKCGTQTIYTGEYGAEQCNPENIPKEIGQTYGCLVLPCEEGEFKFNDIGYRLTTSIYLTIFGVLLYIFVY